MEESSNYYQIYVQGHLNSDWSNWLRSFSIQHQENGITILTGEIPDQTELRGVLDRLFDLGICILSLRSIGFHPEGKSFSWCEEGITLKGVNYGEQDISENGSELSGKPWHESSFQTQSAKVRAQ